MQGEVSFKGEEWNGVSLSAKELIQGLFIHQKEFLISLDYSWIFINEHESTRSAY